MLFSIAVVMGVGVVGWLIGHNFRHYPLRAKLVVAFLGVVLISIGIVSVFNSSILRSRLTAEIGGNLQELARSKAQAVGDLLAKQIDTLEALSVNRVVQDGLEVANARYDEVETAVIGQELQQLEAYWQSAIPNDPLVEQIVTNEIAAELLRFRNQFPENFEVLVTDVQGGLVAATNRTTSYTYAQTDWWQAAYRQGRGGTYIGQSAETKEVFIALPVYGRQSQVVVGVIRARLSLDIMVDILLFEENGRQQRVDLYLPGEGLFVPQISGLQYQSIEETLTNRLQQMATTQMPYQTMPYAEESGLVSQVAVFSYDPSSRLKIDELGWQIIAYQPGSEVFQAINASLGITGVTGLGALLLAGGLAVWLAQWLATPIGRLTAVVQQVTAGDLSVRVPVHTQDEMGQLATTFNGMTARLETTMAALTQHTHMLQTSAEVAQAASSSLNLQRVLQTSVELICERFGFYHASVFIIEPGMETAVLRESNSAVGKTLKQQGYNLVIGSRSLVGTATATHQPCVVQDVVNHPTHYKQPLLPDTRAEAVFPLLVGNLVIGALDVQSTHAYAFTPELTALLETLAAQIAIAVHHARLYEAQKATAERLAELDKLKMQFLANLSHELRTPLNSVIGFSRILMKGMNGTVTPAQVEDLNIIYENGRHLLGIINSLLDLSKIEAGKFELFYEEVDIPDVIESVLSTANGLIKEKQLVLKHHISPHLPSIQADGTRVKQILFNLVSNAIKFTEFGKICVVAHANSEWMTVSIIDTGIGIPKEKIGEIFDEFTQVDNSNTRQYEGTGLGLPISKKLVELHGGRIWVKSEPGLGSTFSFSLPIQHETSPRVTKAMSLELLMA